MIEDVYKYDYIYDGKQIGIAIGREEGRADMAIETAKKMLDRNTDVQFISEVTGLSVDKVLSLK